MVLEILKEEMIFRIQENEGNVEDVQPMWQPPNLTNEAKKRQFF